jgi:hypothetical protein
MSDELDPARCPVCGQPNRCALEIERETGVAAGACWCTQVDFASELLARVPSAARGRACICAACAARLDSGSTQRPS